MSPVHLQASSSNVSAGSRRSDRRGAGASSAATIPPANRKEPSQADVPDARKPGGSQAGFRQLAHSAAAGCLLLFVGVVLGLAAAQWLLPAAAQNTPSAAGVSSGASAGQPAGSNATAGSGAYYHWWFRFPLTLRNGSSGIQGLFPRASSSSSGGGSGTAFWGESGATPQPPPPFSLLPISGSLQEGFEAESDAANGGGGGEALSSEGVCDLAAQLQRHWQPVVPPRALRRSLSYAGDLLRMDTLLHKLVVRREPLTVVAFGGEATQRTAGRRGPQPQLLNVWEERSVPSSGWLSLTLDRLVAAFPPSRLKRWRRRRSAEDLEGQRRGLQHWLPFLRSGAATSGSGRSGAEWAEPYWLINLGLTHLGPEDWATCDGSSFLPLLPASVDLIVVEPSLSSGDPSFLRHLDALLQRLLLRWRDPRLRPLQHLAAAAAASGPQGAAASASNAGGEQATKPQQQLSGDANSSSNSSASSSARSLSHAIVESVAHKGPLGAPAVVLMNFFAFCRNLTVEQCRQQSSNFSYDSVGVFSFSVPPARPQPVGDPSHAVLEDNATVLAQYYAVPSVSVRNALLPLVVNQVPGFSPAHLNGLSLSHTGPNSSAPSQAPSDLADAALPATPRSVAIHSDLLLHLFSTALEGFPLRMAELQQDPSLHALLPFLLAVPRPFFLRWEFSLPLAQPRPPASCLSFHTRGVAPLVAASEGFEMGEVAGRTALVSGNGAGPGKHFVEFVVDTVNLPAGLEPKQEVGPGSGQALDTDGVEVEVRYLVSSTLQLGEATVGCTAGCTCASARIQGNLPVPEDVVEGHRLQLQSVSSQCHVKVEASGIIPIMGLVIWWNNAAQSVLAL